MDRYLLVVLDHLELRVIHANALAAQARFSEYDQLLSGRDHFLHVMQVEPAQRERLAQCIRIRFFQRRFEDFFPTAETPQLRFDHLAAKANWGIAFLAREMRKLMSIFVTPRKMRQQIFHRLNPEPPQRQQLRARDPIKLQEWLRDLHYLIGAASRIASIRISTSVSPS